MRFSLNFSTNNRMSKDCTCWSCDELLYFIGDPIGDTYRKLYKEFGKGEYKRNPIFIVVDMEYLVKEYRTNPKYNKYHTDYKKIVLPAQKKYYQYINKTGDNIRELEKNFSESLYQSTKKLLEQEKEEKQKRLTLFKKIGFLPHWVSSSDPRYRISVINKLKKEYDSKQKRKTRKQPKKNLS
jgi:uncharacterized protein YbgA (DUF1722 family)